MAPPVLFGATYSVYTRICRLALEEKGVPYRLEEVDVFAPDGPPPDYLRRQPFGKIPAFEHDGFALYESGAISRYVDEAFDGPPLQPQDPQPRARMNQAISILVSYAYRAWVWGLFVERVRKRCAARHPTKRQSRLRCRRRGRPATHWPTFSPGSLFSAARGSAWPTCTRRRCWPA